MYIISLNNKVLKSEQPILLNIKYREDNRVT